MPNGFRRLRRDYRGRKRGDVIPTGDVEPTVREQLVREKFLENLVRDSSSHGKNRNLSSDDIRTAKSMIRREWTEYAKTNYANIPKIVSIKLVGSRAKGTAREDSDADFKVVLDKVPIRIHTNPRTGEKTELTVDYSMATTGFTNHIKDSNTPTVSGIHIDPFIVYDPHQTTYTAPT